MTAQLAQPMPRAAQGAEENVRTDGLRYIRWLIWTYFGLLLFEGALRKWALPSLANPLLIIRDPVLLGIYALAFARGVFPTNRFVLALAALGVLCLGATMFAPMLSLGVHVFGFRCNFLHLPLIFVIGRVFDLNSVKVAGRWLLLLTLPMTALVVFQFRSAPDSWLNAGAGADAVQITLTGNKVRPSGTFSFVSGIIYFYALATAFVIYGFVEKRTYSLWLTSIAGLCIPVALAVSGSRSTVAMSIIVAAMFVLALFLRPALLGKAMKLIGIVAALVFVAGSLAIFKSSFDEGVEAFGQRLKEAEHVEGGFEGFVNRFVRMFTKPLQFMFDMPLLGYGLGVGTNVGAKLLTGQTDFVLAEDEWERVICESGPFLGIAYLLVRLLMALQLGRGAVRALRAGHFLPLLLVGACAPIIVAGQFGQSTTLGFAVVAGGLCLASMRVPGHSFAAARMPRRKLPGKVIALRAAVEARRNAARGTTRAKLTEQRP
jgi:hypothetical protein